MAKTEEKAPATPAVDSELQARWDAFLAKAEQDSIKNGTHAIFLDQKSKGEFDKIPESFTQNHSIRQAP